MNAEFFEALTLLEKERGISADYLLEKIQSQFLFFYKDMQCCCCFCHDRALSGKDEAGYTTTLLFSPPDFH